MRIREDEWPDFMRLLAAARSGAIDHLGEQRLRFLVSKETSLATSMTLQQLVDHGHFLVGLHAFLEWAEERKGVPTSP